MEVELVMLAAACSSSRLPLAEGFISGGQLALIAIIVIAITLMLIAQSRRRSESGPSPRVYAREQLARLKEEKVVHDEITEIMSHLQQLAREINAQLDAKFVRLERCVRDADDRIDRLDRLLRRAQGGSSLDVTVSQETTKPLSPTSNEIDNTHRARIYTLADAGKSAKEIARGVERPIGEVELVLALRAAKAGAASTAQV